MTTKPKTTLAMVVTVFALGGHAAVAQHGGDVWIGRTADSQLNIGGYDVDENTTVLPPVSGPLNGWSDNRPGFDHIVVAEPESDLYPMDPGADIWLEIVDIDPAFRFIDSGFQIYDEPGESMWLGDEGLHVHPIWHINSVDPEFDDLRTLWRATLILRDTGSTAYDPSETFVMRFANVECTTGDMNDDGQVNEDDVPIFYDVLADPASATPEERCAADANSDGLVTAEDEGPFLALVQGTPGDFDGDGDVDLSDFSVFAQCFAGADNPPAPGCPPGVDADLDGDGDVDLTDFSIFAENFTGSL